MTSVLDWGTRDKVLDRTSDPAAHGRIAHLKIPKHVYFVAAFPMTVTGKVQKYRLRELAAAALAPNTSGR